MDKYLKRLNSFRDQTIIVIFLVAQGPIRSAIEEDMERYIYISFFMYYKTTLSILNLICEITLSKIKTIHVFLYLARVLYC